MKPWNAKKHLAEVQPDRRVGRREFQEIDFPCIGGVVGHVEGVRVVSIRHRVTTCRVMVSIPNSTLSMINL